MAENAENNMSFIVQQQAQFWTDIQAIKERQAETTRQIAKHDEQIGTLTNLIGRLAQAEINLLERMNQLAEAQTHTDRRLDALVDVVDKLIRRNGGAH